MATFSEKLTILSNPAPKVFDPEDDVNIETVAKVVKQADDFDNEVLFTTSQLRSQAAALLNDCDPAYIGKKVSRKSLSGIYYDESKDFDSVEDEDLGEKVHEGSEYSGEEVHKESEDSGEDVHEESEDSEDLEQFKLNLDKQNDSIEGIEDSEEEGEESEDSDVVGTSDDINQKFSNIAVRSEIEKQDAVKAQKALWNKLCEARIKLQKLLIVANKLPQSNNWDTYKKKAEQDMIECITKSSNSLKLLLNVCLDLQSEFMNKVNSEGKDGKTSEVSDEEIPSDTDEENKIEHKVEQKVKQKKKFKTKGVKRKLKCIEYNQVLAEHHETLTPYRNSVIQKWDDKTKLSSGNITQKSFSAFESSALKQIEQIVRDEDRLIKRTQLKRSLYRVLGKPEVKVTEVNPDSENVELKQDMLLKDYDVEIFDDDDFYRKLLKEVIESKSVSMDPSVLRKQMEIQNIRSKIKRKVDTKASKGRKIRYDIHPKLVGFMKKERICSISDEARESLLKSLFGRNANGLS